jgi:hypothetical protein
MLDAKEIWTVTDAFELPSPYDTVFDCPVSRN